MKKITMKDVERLKKELNNESNIKRRMFLTATINLYLERTGK